MKTKFKILLALSALLVSVALTSCVSERVGPSGQDGWSDIRVIDFDIRYDHWQRDNIDLNSWYYISKSNLIDYYVIDNGAVLFYYGYIQNDGNVNKWFFIPFTNVYWDDKYGGYFDKIFDATYSFETMEITIRDTYPDYLDLAETDDIRIKAVIMDGTHYNAMKKQDVDMNNYGEVSSALKLDNSVTAK